MERGQAGFEIMIATVAAMFIFLLVGVVVFQKESEVKETTLHLNRLQSCRLVANTIASTLAGGNGTEVQVQMPWYRVFILQEDRVIAVGETERDAVTCTYIPPVVSTPVNGTLSLEKGTISVRSTGEQVVLSNV